MALPLPSAAGHFPNAPRRADAARQPVRFAADLKPRPLGAARTRCRSQIPDLDGGQPAAPGSLRRSARRQASGGGSPSHAVLETPIAIRKAFPRGKADRRRYKLFAMLMLFHSPATRGQRPADLATERLPGNVVWIDLLRPKP